MYIIERKLQECITINGNITVKICSINRPRDGGPPQVRIGIQAPREVVIDREEIHLEKQIEAAMKAYRSGP